MGGKSNKQPTDLKQLFAWAALIVIVFWLVANRPDQASNKVAFERGPVVEEATATAPAPETGGKRAEIITELLNLRSEPHDSKRNVIGTIRKGLVVEVLEKIPGWLKVKLEDGRSGYVAYQSKYVKFLKE